MHTRLLSTGIKLAYYLPQLDDIKEFLHENLYDFITLNQNQLGNIYDFYCDTPVLPFATNDILIKCWLENLSVYIPKFINSQVLCYSRMWPASSHLI